nr:uncharacterized protein LOC104103308 [Nicotiana tomentosiformis]
MGGRKSVLPSARIRGNRLHMEKHHLPIQPTQKDKLRQRAHFTGKKTIEFFEKWHIKRILLTPYHPVGNGHAESSNKSILNIIKKKLEEDKGLCPDIIPEVLWAHKTTPKTSKGETHFSIVYGIYVVILVEVGEPNLRYSHESDTSNDENMRQDLDEIEER